MNLEERWCSYWRNNPIPVPEEHIAWTAKHIYRRYRDKQRGYHGYGHIEFCFSEFDSARLLAPNPSVIEVALPLHDVINNPLRKDNESRSSRLSKDYLERLGATRYFIDGVRKAILCTKHDHKVTDPDGQFLCDIDLTGFGQPWATVLNNSHGIRKEYHWYSESDFRVGRVRVLEMFDSRDPIYYTQHFREKYEAKAHENLKREIQWLLS